MLSQENRHLCLLWIVIFLQIVIILSPLVKSILKRKREGVLLKMSIDDYRSMQAMLALRSNPEENASFQRHNKRIRAGNVEEYTVLPEMSIDVPMPPVRPARKQKKE